MEVNDISNLHQDGSVMARDDRKRLFSLGNMLWHSDSSFKATPAKFSLLSARVIPGTDGNTEFADMRAAWDALDPAMQAQVRDLITEHSQIYSRGVLGFTEFTAGGAGEMAAGAAAPGAPASAAPGGSRCSSRRMPAPSRAGRCRRRAPCCAT